MVFDSKDYIIPIVKHLLNNCANNRLAHTGVTRQNIYSYCTELWNEVGSTLQWIWQQTPKISSRKKDSWIILI